MNEKTTFGSNILKIATVYRMSTGVQALSIENFLFSQSTAKQILL